ncbi:MAG: DUF421 domain-containing protein [Geminicoccaceae bacterium]
MIEGAAQLALGLGAEAKDLGLAQMALRAAVVYVATLLIVRLGKKRFMGRSTAFDVILGVMLGATVSRAITGDAPFFPALAAGGALVVMHWVFSAAALRWHGFGVAVKGRSQVLVRDGEPDRAAMQASHVSERDLAEDLRSKGMSRLEQVAEARLERSGKLSIVPAEQEPKVVEVAVAGGVQTVRIELA